MEPVKAQCHVTEYQRAYRPLPKEPIRENIYSCNRPLQTSLGEHFSANPKFSPPYRDTHFTDTRRPLKIVKLRTEHASPTKAMVATPTHIRDLSGQAENRPGSCKPDKQCELSMDGLPDQSAYQMSYRMSSPEERTLCKVEPIRHKECLQRNSGEVEAMSTTKADFTKHRDSQRPSLIRPRKDNNVLHPDRCNDVATYRLQYAQRSHRDSRFSTRSLPEHKESSSATATTTSRADYQPYPDLKPQPSCKPLNEYQLSKGKFQGKRTAADTYQLWPVQKPEKEVRQWVSRPPFAKTGGPFLVCSTYRSDFKRPLSDCQGEPPRPQNSRLTLKPGSHSSGNATYRLTTHYRDDPIQRGSVDNPRTFAVRQAYAPPKEPMMCKTTYQAAYRGLRGERARTCTKATETFHCEDKSMAFSTTYEDSYIYRGDQQLECPARQLASLSRVSGCKLTITDNGHLIYGKSHQGAESTRAAVEQQPDSSAADVCAEDVHDTSAATGSATNGAPNPATEATNEPSSIYKDAATVAEKGTKTLPAPASSAPVEPVTAKAGQGPRDGGAIPSLTQLYHARAALRADAEKRGLEERREQQNFCQSCFQALTPSVRAQDDEAPRGDYV